ncbi:MAG: hypothetical protein JNL95_07875 [Chitinophagales bacterium]|nr:hypothetical protein [Chitinophagales bacterium]
MKTKLMFAACLCLTTILSCKKETALQKSYTDLNAIAQPVTLPKVNESVAQRLYDTVADIRAAFITQLATDYPGLKSQMDADWKTYIETTDTALQQSALNKFNQLYYTPVLNTWNKVAPSSTSITNRYSAILGSTPFVTGPFGTITILSSEVTPGSIPDYPNDSTKGYIACPQLTKNESCGAIAANTILHSAYSTTVDMRASLAGGCNITTTCGIKTNLPDRVYRYLAVKTRCNYSDFHCIAGAFIGGSYAQATFSLGIDVDGVNTMNREIINASVVAPIIWYAEASMPITFNTELPIAMRNDAGLTMGEYHAYSKTTNVVSTGGVITGSISDTHFSKNYTTIYYTK